MSVGQPDGAASARRVLYFFFFFLGSPAGLGVGLILLVLGGLCFEVKSRGLH